MPVPVLRWHLAQLAEETQADRDEFLTDLLTEPWPTLAAQNS